MADEIGKLRWPVVVATRVQVAAGTDTINETVQGGITMHADIQSIGAMTFYAGQQTDRPITHRIRMRWLDWIDETHVIIRTTRRPDFSIRREVFRIRRVKEVEGRKRFIELECEQEVREST